MALIANFDEVLSYSSSIQILSELALSHCRDSSPYSDEIAAAISRGDFKYLCDYKLRYDAGIPVHALLHIRQALGFFTKLEDLDIGVDKESVARRKFYESEVSCLRTNQILNAYSRGDFSFPRDVQSVISRAARKIEQVLGPVPSLSELELLFGPGATTSVQKRNACARTKLSAVPSCSENMLPLVPALLAETPHYAALHSTSEDEETWSTPVELHPGKIAFVPKNAKTYRTVMTEPTLNALAQAGFGRVITARLRRVGIDLEDQTLNQRLALEGSLTGALATLDLSSASDSISTELVAELLPYEWFSALSLCRTPTVLIDGKELLLHKFSSMGNGFTFPLQTLIFWALTKSCSEISHSAEQRVSVYGDDIICGVGAIPLVLRVFHCVGFTINEEKSYWSTPFRESCGVDYYSGFNIRPFYAKSLVSGELLFLLHNYYYRSFDEARANKVLSLIDPSLRIFGPDGYGDGHLLRDDWNRKPYKRDCGYGGYVFETYTWKPRYHTKVLSGDRVLPAYSVYVRSFNEEEAYAVNAWPDPVSAEHGVHIAGPATPHKGHGDLSYPVLVTPGTRGVKRIKIYTLSA